MYRGMHRQLVAKDGRRANLLVNLITRSRIDAEFLRQRSQIVSLFLGVSSIELNDKT